MLKTVGLRSADIYDKLKIKPIIETIRTDQSDGLVVRRDEKTATKKVLDLNRKRSRGKPRTSWLQCTGSILRERAMNL